MSRRRRTCPDDAVTALFLEGGDEEAMVRAVANTSSVFVQVIGGTTEKKMGDAVAAATRDPGWPKIRRVGVLVDAGEDPDRAWAFVNDLYTVLGVEAPKTPEIVEDSGDWTVAAFLLPGGRRCGGSDTLLLDTVTSEKRACVDTFFACTGEPPGTLEQRDKARAAALTQALCGIRTYEWWRQVDQEHAALKPLKAFLNELIGP